MKLSPGTGKNFATLTEMINQRQTAIIEGKIPKNADTQEIDNFLVNRTPSYIINSSNDFMER